MMGTLHKRASALVAGWGEFFFRPTAVTGIVAFRIFLSVWSICYWTPRFDHAWELYCRPVLRSYSSQVAWVGIPPLWLVQVAFGVLLFALVMFAVSKRPRYWHIVVLVPLFFLHGLDTLMGRAFGEIAYLQWWLLFLAPYDRLVEPNGSVVRAPISGVRLLQLQWAAVYFFAAFAKLDAGGGWLDGSTMWTYLHSDKHGLWLLSAWWDIPRVVAKGLGLTTLLLELFVPIAIFIPATRRLAMVACLAIHIGILVTLRVSLLFPLLMWGHLLLFLTESEWRSILARWAPCRVGS